MSVRAKKNPDPALVAIIREARRKHSVMGDSSFATDFA